MAQKSNLYSMNIALAEMMKMKGVISHIQSNLEDIAKGCGTGKFFFRYNKVYFFAALLRHSNDLQESIRIWQESPKKP